MVSRPNQIVRLSNNVNSIDCSIEIFNMLIATSVAYSNKYNTNNEFTLTFDEIGDWIPTESEKRADRIDKLVNKFKKINKTGFDFFDKSLEPLFNPMFDSIEYKKGTKKLKFLAGKGMINFSNREKGYLELQKGEFYDGKGAYRRLILLIEQWSRVGHCSISRNDLIKMFGFKKTVRLNYLRKKLDKVSEIINKYFDNFSYSCTTKAKYGSITKFEFNWIPRPSHVRHESEFWTGVNNTADNTNVDTENRANVRVEIPSAELFSFLNSVDTYLTFDELTINECISQYEDENNLIISNKGDLKNYYEKFKQFNATIN